MTMNTTVEVIVRQVSSLTSDMLARHEKITVEQKQLDRVIIEQQKAVVALRTIDPESEHLTWAEESLGRVTGA